MLKVKVVAFGPLTDQLPREQMVEVAPGATTRSLLSQLGLDAQAEHLKVAIDGAIVANDAALVDGAEIMLLPPSSGG